MDKLKQPRDTVAAVIAKLQTFQGEAGSEEMRSVQTSLMHLGNAYSTLQSKRDPNPAWSGMT